MRTLISFILAAYASFLISVPARGQVLYETNGNDGTVGAYNPLTGALINGNFITVGNNVGMAFDSTSNILYLAHGNNVGEYNATTGAPVGGGANFISSSSAYGLALGNAVLYVTDDANSKINAYSASTGSAIAGFSLTGVSTRYILALGNTLYVTDGFNNRISTYNAATGALITANFITGLSTPSGITVSGTNLWVANSGSGVIGEYNVNTGAPIATNFASGSFLSDVKYYNGELYVGEFSQGASVHNVAVFNAISGGNTPVRTFSVEGGPFFLQVVPETSTWVIAGLAAGLIAIQLIQAALFSRRQSGGSRRSS
jgi:hypothetical protein